MNAPGVHGTSTTWVGVDAGGSHTEVVVLDGRDQILARTQGPPGAVSADTVADSAAAILDTTRRALRDATAPVPADGMVAGVAGAGDPTTREALCSALAGGHVARAVDVTTDVALVYEGAYGEQSGIVLVSGSGSIAYGRDPSGAAFRSGGHGWRAGDQGSGYAIGRAALDAVLEGVVEYPTDQLADRLRRAVGVSTVDALHAWARRAPPSQIAALATSVQAAASLGDEAARAIVEDAAMQLTDLVRDVRARFSSVEPVPLVLWGGVLTPGAPVRTALLAGIGKLHPPVWLCDVAVDPALAAARRGRAEAAGP